MSDLFASSSTVPTPPPLPEPRELRVLAGHLKSLYPVEGLRDLVARKDYDAAQQLVGALDVIDAIGEIADGLEEESAEQATTSTLGSTLERLFTRA